MPHPRPRGGHSDRRRFKERMRRSGGGGAQNNGAARGVRHRAYRPRRLYEHTHSRIHRALRPAHNKRPPSLIPSFCGEGFYGLRVHEAALRKGVKVTGATVHYVNEIPDGGEIIAQRAVEVHDGDTPEQLQRRVMEQAEWIILPQAAEAVCRKIRENDR